MPYVDGFIVPVPKKNLAAYRSLAKKAGKIWREYGALDYCEWVAEDVKVGKLTSFPRSVKLKPGETVVFSWITYKSRAQRDKVNAKVMSDKRLAGMMTGKEMPFDGKRMIYGGFASLVKAWPLHGGLFALNGAIDRIDQQLGLDELDPRPLGLVAVERRGQRLCEGVAVVGHALARLFQRFKSLAHGGLLSVDRNLLFQVDNTQICYRWPYGREIKLPTRVFLLAG